MTGAQILFRVFVIGAVFCIANGTLLFTQVWFRHGERAPTKYVRFPSEPIDFDKNFPVSHGELTIRGKQMEYTLGQRLRETYKEFLSPTYKSHEVRLYFDADNRTSQSAELAAAGLFPPTQEETWNANLAWQPIPLHEEPVLKQISIGLLGSCPLATQRIEASTSYKTIFNNADQQIVQFLRSATDAEMNDVRSLNDVVDALVTRYRMNDTRLPMPNWFTPTWYNKLDNLTNYLHRSFMDLTRKETIGWHLARVLDEFDDHLTRPNGLKSKLVLFSGHDTNIMAFGREMELEGVGGHLPWYGSNLAFELHNISGILTVEVWFAADYGAARVQKQIPQCGTPCKYSTFVNLYKPRRYSAVEWWNYCAGWGPLESHDGSVIAILLVLLIILLLTNIFLLYKCLAARKALGAPDETRPLLN